jgi:hypothetical protein
MNPHLDFPAVSNLYPDTSTCNAHPAAASGERHSRIMLSKSPTSGGFTLNEAISPLATIWQFEFHSRLLNKER